MGPDSMADIHLGSSPYISNQCIQPLLKTAHIFGLLFVIILAPTVWALLSHLGLGFAIQGSWAVTVFCTCIGAAGAPRPESQHWRSQWGEVLAWALMLAAFPGAPQPVWGRCKAVPKGQKTPLPRQSTALPFSPSAFCACRDQTVLGHLLCVRNIGVIC